MTGAEMKDIRKGLSDAIGRRLTLADMAKLCGVDGSNWRRWEEGDGCSGPVAVLLSLYAWAIDGAHIPGKQPWSEHANRQIEDVRSLMRYQILYRLEREA